MIQGNLARKYYDKSNRRQKVEQEFYGVYRTGSPHRIEIVDKGHFRPPAVSMPDGCMEIDFPMAEAMVKAAGRGQQNGGFVVIKHEDGHYWESTPLMTTSPSELKKMGWRARLKFSWRFDAFSWRHINHHHAEEDRLELREGGRSQWQADLYALANSDNPVEDFALAIAITALREFEVSWAARVLWSLRGARNAVESDIEEMFRSYGSSPFRDEALKVIAKKAAEKFQQLRD